MKRLDGKKVFGIRKLKVGVCPMGLTPKSENLIKTP